jgi:hypothetical protein
MLQQKITKTDTAKMCQKKMILQKLQDTQKQK